MKACLRLVLTKFRCTAHCTFRRQRRNYLVVYIYKITDMVTDTRQKYTIYVRMILMIPVKSLVHRVPQVYRIPLLNYGYRVLRVYRISLLNYGYFTL